MQNSSPSKIWNHTVDRFKVAQMLRTLRCCTRRIYVVHIVYDDVNLLISENLLCGPAAIGAWMLAIQKVYRGTKLSLGTFTTPLPDSSNKT